MPTNLKRMTFVITPEMESLLDGMKKEKFYNCSQSEMIRALVEAGLSSLQIGKKSSKTERKTD